MKLSEAALRGVGCGGGGGGGGGGVLLVSLHTVSAMEVAYREQARRVRAAANRIPPAFSMQFYNSANQLATAEIENGPVGSEREREREEHSQRLHSSPFLFPPLALYSESFYYKNSTKESQIESFYDIHMTRQN